MKTQKLVDLIKDHDANREAHKAHPERNAHCLRCWPDQVSFEITTSSERISDLLVGAFEGGSNYWYKILSQSASGHPADVIIAGGSVVVGHDENDDDQYSLTFNEKPLAPVDLAACITALELMAKGHGDVTTSHFSNFMGENEDAITADVFLQYALFGEVVYG